MPGIPASSVRFREHLLRSRTLIVGLIGLDKNQEPVFVLKSPVKEDVRCILTMSHSARAKQLRGTRMLTCLVSKWGLVKVNIPVHCDETTTLLSDDECAFLRSELARYRGRGSDRTEQQDST